MLYFPILLALFAGIGPPPPQINESINQSINEWMNEWINQSINQTSGVIKSLFERKIIVRKVIVRSNMIFFDRSDFCSIENYICLIDIFHLQEARQKLAAREARRQFCWWGPVVNEIYRSNTYNFDRTKIVSIKTNHVRSNNDFSNNEFSFEQHKTTSSSIFL